MTGLCERLRAKIAEQRERRGDIIDYGEPDDELVEALARIEALEAALDEIAHASWPSVNGDDPVKRIQTLALRAQAKDSK